MIIMKKIQLKIKLEDGAVMPQYQTEHAAGFDVNANVKEPVTIRPGERMLIPTGLKMAIPPGYEAQVRPRSGLAIKQGISIVNTPGTVDADYRGEIGIILINHGKEDFIVNPKDRIAQIIINKVEHPELLQAEELDETKRGEGGFGSTGTEHKE